MKDKLHEDSYDEGRKEVRVICREEGRKDSMKEGRKDGRTEGRTICI
jgi:hypothetical protein